MMREPSTHLSEEALNDVLIGLASRESESHLADCEVCRARVSAFRSDLDSFHQSSLAWSESRSNSMERIQVPSKPARIPYASLGWTALAAVLLLAIAVPFWHYSDRFRSNQNAGVTVPHEDSAAQIAQDNELLEAVNAAINQDDKSLANEYQFLERPHPHQKAPPE